MASFQPMFKLGTQFLTISCLGMGALQASSPSLRVLLLGSICYVGINAFRTYVSALGGSPSLASLIGLFLLIWLLHLTELLWVENHVVSGAGALSRLRAAYKMLFNVRRTALVADSKQAGTAEERSGVEGHPRQRQTQFRNQHLIKTSVLAGLFWTYSKAVTAILVPVFITHSNLTVHGYAFPPLINDTIVRIILVADLVLGTYLMDNIFHSLFALLFVNLLRLDSPEEWPALWGSIAGTSSVRDFWAKFWHKLVQRTLVGLSSYLLRGIGVASRGPVGRVLVPFLVFLLSGIVHGLVNWNMGIRCGWWTEITWFCAQFVVIVLEVAVAANAKRHLKLTPTIRATTGYTWTWCWLLYSIPKLQFAKMRCGLVS